MLKQKFLIFSTFASLISLIVMLITQTPHPSFAKPQAISLGTWRVETVDKSRASEATTGGLQNPSLAIGSNGVPQIAYSDSEDGIVSKLTYTQKPGTTWVTTTVDAAAGEKPVLALNAQNQPRIAYFDFATDNLLRYRVFDGANWPQQTVITGFSSVQASADLALDSAGKPYIAFSSKDTVSYTLSLAVPSGISWTVEPVGNGVGSAPSLALDSANQVHISYQDTNSRTLSYALRTNTGWLTETVGEPDDAAIIGSSLVVDAANTPHIAYVNYPRKELVYAKRVNGAWVKEKVGSESQAVTLALDKTGAPHIAYIEPQTLRPIYAVRMNSTWVTSTASTDAAAFISLALDPNGLPAIAYTDFDTGDLRLARLSRSIVYMPLVRK